MQVISVPPVGFGANSYLLTKDNTSAVCIDPSSPHVLFEAEKRSLQVRYVLLTHGHFDHVGGCLSMQKAGATILLPEGDSSMMTDENRNMGAFFGKPVPPYTARLLQSEKPFSLCGISVRPIFTAGHTRGSTCYLVEDMLFSGDTIFSDGVGRTDLPTGNGEELKASLLRLKELAKERDYILYPGHGEPSTLRASLSYILGENIC